MAQLWQLSPEQYFSNVQSTRMSWDLVKTQAPIQQAWAGPKSLHSQQAPR